MKREDILTALKTQLQTISGSNYNFDLGNNINIWLMESVNESDLPVVNIKDLSDNIDRTNEQRWLHTLDVEITIATNGSTVVSDMRKMINDIYTCIGNNSELNGLAHRILPVNDFLGKEDQDDEYSWATINIKILFGTAAWQN